MTTADMPPMPNRTSFARLSPWQARLTLAAWGLVCVFFLGVSLSPMAQGNAERKRENEGDVKLYQAEVARIQAGEGYYEAVGAELTARGYPTRSVFNWRTPLPVWLIGKMPSPVLGKALLCGLALALMALCFEVLAREDDNAIGRAVAGAVLLTGPLMPCLLDGLYVMPVLWAGVLIALSVCCYGLNRPRWGLALGLAAVFFRDLALPYCLLAMAMAWWNRRRGEVVAWAVGLAAWGLFFAWHWLQVADLRTPDARAHTESWIQLGGAGFVIAIAQMNAYLLLLPQWVTALFLVASLLGLAGWNTPLGTRAGLTVCLFLMAFAVVGQEFNQYWGSLVAPLLCLGLVRFPAAMRDLWFAGQPAAVPQAAP